jgi:UDP-N-acetylmuramate dehydrogenase
MSSRRTADLKTLTTLKVGGPTTYIDIETIDDLEEFFITQKQTREQWYVLGGGSNVLAPDVGFDGVILRMCIQGIEYREESGSVLVRAGGGVDWDAFVTDTVQRGLWGIENLAGIPGTVGAAPVQNIGAYGVEVEQSITHVEAFDTDLLRVVSIPKDRCNFSYRTSLFKNQKKYIITRVEFVLSPTYNPKTHYKDIALELENNAHELTPQLLAETVTRIRKRKFPDMTVEGTAGSFFKNPIISLEKYQRLAREFQSLPSYPAREGYVKIPAAYILDVVLHLRGYTLHKVRCFETQPLVIVAEVGASADDVEHFAKEIEKKVFDATKIKFEREVQTIK